MNLRMFARITLPLAAVNALTQAARSSMSTIGPPLAVQYGFGSAVMGWFSAVMFGSYCLAQIPAGIAMDRWGPRRVQFVLCLTAAAGFAIFAGASNTTEFFVGRIVTGVGVAAGLIGMLKGHSQWFAPTDVAKATGYGMAVGTLGSLLTTAPAQAVLPVLGWRGLMFCCAAASIAVAIWNWLSVPELPASDNRSFYDELRELRSIIRAPAFHRLAPIAALLTALNFTYLGLWAGPWLRDVAHQTAQTRANVLFLYTVGLLVGGPLTGLLVSRMQRRGGDPMRVARACTVGSIMVQVAFACRPTHAVTVGILWLLFAILCSCGPAAYAAVAHGFPSGQAGRVSTGVNTLTLALVFALQISIGELVGWWPKMADSTWSSPGYSAGFAVTIILQTLALLHARVRPDPVKR